MARIFGLAPASALVLVCATALSGAANQLLVWATPIYP
jgi:hypothetical protein